MLETTVLTASEMRQKYEKSPSIGPYLMTKDYLDYLLSKGISLNDKLQPSVFQLKNGLPFIGMAAKQTINGREVLIRVPEELILSSAKAAQQPLLAEVYQDNFFIHQNHIQEDRVIIVYCLFLLYQKDQNNPWYQMALRFPKECDVAGFWNQQQLDSFKDKTVKKNAENDRKGFQSEWQQFQALQQKHVVLQHPEFNKQNYKTVFMTLLNRAFGASLNYVSLVPFAELFNHHCSTVFYTTQKNTETYFKNFQTSEEPEQQSLGSCESDEYLEDNEFAYDRIDVIPYNWDCEESYRLQKKDKQIIKNEAEEILESIDKSINWDSFGIKVVGPLLFKTQVIRREYLVGRKPFSKALDELRTIHKSIQLYIELVNDYFNRVNKKSYYKSPQKKEESKPIRIEDKTIYPPVTKQYESLIIKTGKTDTFSQNNQVFFKYGNSSNRTLLLHYGFAIEGNKYQHCWVTLNLATYLKEFPDVLEKFVQKNLSLCSKFKIYNHRLNVDLIIFFRLNNWSFYGEKAIQEIFGVTSISKEIKVLQQIIQLLSFEAKVYEGDYDLTNAGLNYHQYFIEVYHLEKLKILKKQISLLNSLIDILSKINKGMKMEQATMNLTYSERKIIDGYLRTVRL